MMRIAKGELLVRFYPLSSSPLFSSQGTGKPVELSTGFFVFVVYVYNFLFGLSAALYAAVVIPNKRVETENVYETTVIRLVAAAVVIIIPCLLLTEGFSAVTVNVTAVGVVLSEGIVHTGIAYALHFGSMKT